MLTIQCLLSKNGLQEWHQKFDLLMAFLTAELGIYGFKE